MTSICIPSHPLAKLFTAITLATAPCAQAVLISSGDGSGNTSAGEVEFAFDNVGQRGSATAVYLGNGYVLTANHVGTGSVQLNGQTYEVEAGSTRRMQNPESSGLSTYTDLKVFRLTEIPELPALTIATEGVATGDHVIMVGNGYNRASEQTMWDVSTKTYPNVWTETTKANKADVFGYKTASGKTIRWGENIVEGAQTVGLGTHGQILSFYTQFDTGAGSLEHEAQATNGDSGGAVFSYLNEEWQLVGIMHAVSDKSPYSGNPDDEINSKPFAYDGKVTYSSDLSQYDLTFGGELDFSQQAAAAVQGIQQPSPVPEPNAAILLSSLALIIWKRRKI